MDLKKGEKFPHIYNTQIPLTPIVAWTIPHKILANSWRGLTNQICICYELFFSFDSPLKQLEMEELGALVRLTNGNSNFDFESYFHILPQLTC